MGTDTVGVIIDACGEGGDTAGAGTGDVGVGIDTVGASTCTAGTSPDPVDVDTCVAGVDIDAVEALALQDSHGADPELVVVCRSSETCVIIKSLDGWGSIFPIISLPCTERG